MRAPGEPAADFDVALVEGDGRARLDDYRGRCHLFLVLLRSFECPFCRRNPVALKHTADDMRARGIETLAVTTTPVKAARLYARYRPPGLPLASDPTLAIHRAYGVPIYRIDGDRPTQWPQTVNPADLGTLILNPSPELPEALPAMEAGARLNAEDGFEAVTTDETGPPDDVSPLISYFLVDRAPTVRWAHVVALDDPADYAQHPSPAELLAAAERLAAA